MSLENATLGGLCREAGVKGKDVMCRARWKEERRERNKTKKITAWWELAGGVGQTLGGCVLVALYPSGVVQPTESRGSTWG